jgi:hypothetical protein
LIESEPLFGFCGNLDGEVWAVWRRMGDGSDGNDGLTVTGLDGQHDDARSILAAFL